MSAMVISISREAQMSTIQRVCGSSVYVRQVDVVHDHGYLYRSGGSALGQGGGTALPPNRGWAPKFSRTLETLWSIGCQNNQYI